jgi:hypothetical protein
MHSESSENNIINKIIQKFKVSSLQRYGLVRVGEILKSYAGCG